MFPETNSEVPEEHKERIENPKRITEQFQRKLLTGF
jgi:hypothetical protein